MPFSELMQIEVEIDDLLLPDRVDLSQDQEISNPELLAHIDRVGAAFYQRAV